MERSRLRCAASIEATVQLDAATFFPQRLKGTVVDKGCEGTLVPTFHYGEPPAQGPYRRMLNQGSTFRIDYALQRDKFGHPEHDYWIETDQHWSKPFRSGASGFVFWSRRFELPQGFENRSLVLDSHTVAQEFGSTSELKFLPEKP